MLLDEPAVRDPSGSDDGSALPFGFRFDVAAWTMDYDALGNKKRSPSGGRGARALRIIIRILINAVALWAAASLIDGITLSSDFVSVLVVAAVFGLVNAFLKPIAQVLSFPLIILTLGLFTLVVNAVMLQITDALTSGIDVDGFWTAVWGGVVISIVSWALSVFLPDDD